MNTTEANYSYYRPLWQVPLLYISTFGFYWFFKTNQQIYQHHPDSIKPFWRTAGLLIPILNVYLVWKLFSDIKKLAAVLPVPHYRYPGLLTLIFVACYLLYWLPGLQGYWGYLAIVPLLIVQKTLNAYWDKGQQGLPKKTWLSFGEVLIIIIGMTIIVSATLGLGPTS